MLFFGEKIIFVSKKNILISILIPIYNCDSRKLVADLHEQGLALDQPFEIIVADDHSSEPFRENESINALSFAQYIFLPKNLGRSGSRNWLAQKANYPYLLFIDGDMGVGNSSFLKTYIQNLNPNRVICGGHYYGKRPQDASLVLHWEYGRTHEQQPASLRNKKPYFGFVPSNFVIPASIFMSIQFDESIKGYGHEDTLFGEQLRNLSVELLHIDNELEHLGLVPASVFMDKADTAVHNLVKLEKNHHFTGTRLQTMAHRLRWLSPAFRLLPVSFLRKRVQKQHDLKLFALYKLLMYYRFWQEE